MNTFAWNITLNGNLEISKDFKFDYLETLSKNWDKNLYLFWETDYKTSKDMIDFFIKTFGELKSYDISISSEDKLELMPYDFEEEIYEVVSFEWEEIDFNEIKDRFLEHDAIFSIRESEVSKKFWNKIIRADFIY